LNRLITTFDEVPPNRIAIHIASELTSEEAMVLPLKRVPPKSFVRSRSEKPKLFRSETRKDSAVHVSLSSSSLVKQPGTGEVPTFLGGRVPTPLPTMNDSNRFVSAVVSLNQGEEHQRRVRSPWSVTRRRRAQWLGYSPPRSGLSTGIVNKSSHGRSALAVHKNVGHFRSLRDA